MKRQIKTLLNHLKLLITAVRFVVSICLDEDHLKTKMYLSCTLLFSPSFKEEEICLNAKKKWCPVVDFALMYGYNYKDHWTFLLLH